MLQKNPAVPIATSVSFTLNGQQVTGSSDETILETADRLGVEIPRLCYMEGMRADGNCRTCMVEIKGERVLAPSCCRYPKEGMEVTTNNARALTALGRLRDQSGDYVQAMANYQRSLELNRFQPDVVARVASLNAAGGPAVAPMSTSNDW